jgi:exodeoxyribonuclease V alpha subunit
LQLFSRLITSLIKCDFVSLPDVKTTFTMTVHKYQGSEFNYAAMVLPETRSQVLTRELVYTGIAQAKENFTLLESHANIFNQAVLATCK